LTDGILARDDYLSAENVQGIGQLGYDWIGWKRKSSTNGTVHMQIEFESKRHLTSIYIHTSNLFTRDIYLFNAISIMNCDEINHRQHVHIPDDRLNSRARLLNITIDYSQKLIGQCFQLILTFHPQSKWILISEILLESSPIIDIELSTTTIMPNKHHRVAIIGK
jgi:hypothetical protein